MAARQDNRIPDDQDWLASLFHVGPDDLEVDLLVDRGWLERRIAPDDSNERLAPNASASAEHHPLDPSACVSTTTVEKSQSQNARARANQKPSPEFADQF